MVSDHDEALREGLSEWTDFDGAAFVLGKALGVFPEETKFATDAKHVFWAANPLGDGLFRCLDELVRVGVLEREEQRYRWNRAFDWRSASR